MLQRMLRSGSVILFCLVASAVLASSGLDGAAAHASDVGRPLKVTLTPEASSSTGDIVLSTVGGGYLSPVVEAESEFTHMLLRWEVHAPGAHQPDHGGHNHDITQAIKIEVRSSVDGQDWVPWVQVVDNHDLWMPEDGGDVYWSQIIYAGEGARFWQVRSSVALTDAGEDIALRSVDVNTVDARFGDTDPAATLDQPDSSSGIGLANVNKPAVVSRTAWGNPDGQWSRVSPAYYPVKHMIVHHTADPNTFRSGESNWGDRVRAIWSFHTFTRGWGDVGYNYLIDRNGVIYEGRAGGDDAVGFHDTGNYGSMGVALVGTFSAATPPESMLNSLTELLAWKASQKGIDPLGSSYYYGCDISRSCGAPGAVVANIGGHRSVTGTECPGNVAFNLLPNMRQRVRARIDGGGGGISPVPDNGDLLIDELEDTFARSEANWYTAACGHGGNTFYTFATNVEEQSTNGAVWRPNIPQDGTYRLLASIPQNCGLPYPTSREATYKVVHADGDTIRRVDHNTAQSWVDLGVYDFRAGTDGAVVLTDLTDTETLDQDRVIFFDSIKWVEEVPQPGLEIAEVKYDRTSLSAGELLKVAFTIRNTGEVVIWGQEPQAATFPDGSFDVEDGYAYDENECFLGNATGTYPIFDKESNRFRLTLGPTNRSVSCAGETGGYPWRWGINGVMQPGETREVIGYIRFREPGLVSLQAGSIQEYVKYHTQGIAPITIEVTPEQVSPVVAGYDGALQPQAHVYRLGMVPPNFLARTANPLSITRGDYVGSFPWDGELQEWSASGPFEVEDRFLVEQVRVFQAPVSGEYMFRTTSDDGSWLWVNGQPVVVNHGLHRVTPMTGTVYLDEGMHVMSFKYFENTGEATAGYDVKVPDGADFGPLTDGLRDAGRRFGNVFLESPDTIVIGADDQGGEGVASVTYSLNGSEWVESPGALIQLGRLQEGTYTLLYRARDAAGNDSEEQSLTFRIDPNLEINRVFMPVVRS